MSTPPRPVRHRFSAQRKREVILRLLRGEDLDIVSRGLGVPGSTLSQWRDAFLEGGLSGLKPRPPGEPTEEVRNLQRKLGEVTMENELLHEKIDRMEASSPFVPRRSRK